MISKTPDTQANMIMFKTTTGAPFHFNFDNCDLKNTVVISPSGKGMSTMSTFLHPSQKRNQTNETKK